MAAFSAAANVSLVDSDLTQPSDTTTIPATNANVIEAAQFDRPRVVRMGYASMTSVIWANAVFGTTFGGNDASDAPNIDIGTAQPLVIWYHDTDHYPDIGGYTAKFRLKLTVITNATDPACTLTGDLYQVTVGATGNTGSGGGDGLKTYGFNTALRDIDISSSIDIALAPGTITQSASSTFALTNGWYGFGLTYGFGPAADSHIHVVAELEVTYESDEQGPGPGPGPG
jgi:hypothetical protein